MDLLTGQNERQLVAVFTLQARVRHVLADDARQALALAPGVAHYREVVADAWRQTDIDK